MDECERFLGELTAAYLIAKGQRLNELNGQRLNRFDARGLHPFSYVYGCATVWFGLTGLEPELLPTAHEVDRVAFADATDEWLREVRAASAENELEDTFRIA